MIEFSKMCLYQNSIFKNIKNPQVFFIKSEKLFLFLFFNVNKANMKKKMDAKRPKTLVLKNCDGKNDQIKS